MKIKTSELSGVALTWAMAAALGIPANAILVDGVPQVWSPDDVTSKPTLDRGGKPRFLLRGTDPCGLFGSQMEFGWGDIGQLIEDELIEAGGPNGRRFAKLYWSKSVGDGRGKRYHEHVGETTLVAVMRCIISSKLGAEVDVPDVLL